MLIYGNGSVAYIPIAKARDFTPPFGNYIVFHFVLQNEKNMIRYLKL